MKTKTWLLMTVIMASLTLALVLPPTNITSVTLNSPTNNTHFANTSVNFTFTATTNITQTFTCRLRVDGVNKATNTSTVNNTLTNFTVTIAEGTRNWYVRCTDPNGNLDSETRTLKVDATTPTVTISAPTNNTNTTNSTTQLNFTITDNVDTNINYEILIDSVSNTNGSSANNTAELVNLTLTDGTHTITVQATDDAGNTKSASITRTTDANAPNVTLTAPTNGSTFNGLTTNFKWTTTDALDGNMTCELSIDGNSAANISTINNTITTRQQTLTTYNTHQWNVQCTDDFGNTGSSLNNTFTNTKPSSSGGGGGGGGGGSSTSRTTTTTAPTTEEPQEIPPPVCQPDETYCAGNCCAQGLHCINSQCTQQTSTTTQEEPQETTTTTTQTFTAPTPTYIPPAESPPAPLGTGLFGLNTDTKNSTLLKLITLSLLIAGLYMIFRPKPKKRRRK